MIHNVPILCSNPEQKVRWIRWNLAVYSKEIKGERNQLEKPCCSQGECDATAGCEGFSFYRGICYLKTQLQGTFLKASRTTFIRRQPTEPGQCASFAETQENKDLAGILVKPPVFAAEQEDCCTACASVPQCEGFSYYRGFCYLKGQLQGTYPKSGSTVNVKNSARRLLGDESSQSVLVWTSAHWALSWVWSSAKTYWKFGPHLYAPDAYTWSKFEWLSECPMISFDGHNSSNWSRLEKERAFAFVDHVLPPESKLSMCSQSKHLNHFHCYR